MKNLILLPALLATLIVSSAWSTKSSDTSYYVEWSGARKLGWEDFRGQINSTSHADAATAIHISAKPFYKKKKIFYAVDAYFIPDQSWYRSKSEALLRHEQLHFDLAELYARKARKKISEYRQMGIRNIADYNNAISRVLQESNRIDMQYDFDTLHGTLSEEQLKWEQNVAQELSIMQNFSRENWR
jgi:hypothetical protein